MYNYPEDQFPGGVDTNREIGALRSSPIEVIGANLSDKL